jgi:hypothetical protein
MPTTKTDIFNMAIGFVGKIGHIQIADADTDTSSDAKALRRFYDATLDAFLEEAWWGFATKYEVLTADVSTAPEGWQTAFKLPTDSVAPRRIVGSSIDDVIEFQEGVSAAGVKVLWCDLTDNDRELEYTYRCEDFSVWSPAAIRAFALALARDVAPAYTGGKKYQEIEAKYFDALDRAMDTSHNRQHVRETEDNEFIENRHGDSTSTRQKARYVAGA